MDDDKDGDMATSSNRNDPLRSFYHFARGLFTPRKTDSKEMVSQFQNERSEEGEEE